MTAAQLDGYTRALALRLPGRWSPSLKDNTTVAQRNALMDRLWELGTAHWALLDFVNDHVGHLRHPAGLDLVVLQRPLRAHQYLVAALVPVGHGLTHQVQDHAVPFGIAVADDAARAAAEVTRRLLPSYQQALRTVGHSAGWSTLTVPASRAVAATGRSPRDTTVAASPPATPFSSPVAGTRRART